MRALFSVSARFITLGCAPFIHSTAFADVEQAPGNHPTLNRQPSFGATINLKNNKHQKQKKVATLESLVLVGGSAYPQLSAEIASLIGVQLAAASVARFNDGEVNLQFHETLFEKDVFIIQPCAAPVNDSIMELLLTVSCARRAGARRVTAVIPYYGYKHHRRGAATSTKHNSRYITSGAVDFAKMLQEMGVDRVISVDLQRPGQGQEACFFDNQVPLESVVTTDYLVNYFVKNIPLRGPIVVIAPNAECVNKARKFQLGFKKVFGPDVSLSFYSSQEVGSGPCDTSQLALLGNPKIAGADVVIVDDMVDSARTVSAISQRLKNAGARNIYVCASHGLFTEDAMEIIEKSAVKKVIVCNTLPLPANASSKVQQVSIAPMLTHVILAEHFRRSTYLNDDEFDLDD